MKLSSFSEIVENKLISISELIPNSEKYCAHIGNSIPETLHEHIRLVLKYFLSIVKKQNLDIVIDKIINEITEGNEFLSNEIKFIFVASIAYHDLGKINPNFQTDKMNNQSFMNENLSIGSQHSLLSSFLFLFYFVELISSNQSISKTDKEFLISITYLFLFPILKHHNSVLTKEITLTKTIIEELYHFLQECKISISLQFATNFLKIKDSIIDRFAEKKQFALFSLIKFSYSLLTACDYYATNEYIADIKVDDFGLINNELRTKIRKNFRTKKSYNRDLFLHFDQFRESPFDELQERNEANLNILRQKLNAEVISILRNNPDNLWYYIEAPTGAGKTNLSLACISELLHTDKNLDKVFYVFPFTTLITQTYSGIQETIGLDRNELIQLHSKAGFHTKEEVTDGEYGKEKKIHLDNLFVNYPVCVTSHIRFFDILKGNNKESNYLLHRLCNSIVVIDELQTYNPKHWDKILYFIENYARLFNMRFIIMSATLPKIDVLSETFMAR